MPFIIQTHFPVLLPWPPTDSPLVTYNPPTTQNILDRRMHIPARRQQRADVLRRIREPHILQLLQLHLEALFRGLRVRWGGRGDSGGTCSEGFM